MSPADLDVLAGDGPLVWLAPHGGTRNASARPWARERLRVNDLHTATLTAELARATGAPALVNARTDRNDIDLNRISEAHDRAPRFLETLAELLEAAIARHGRATLLVVHGWNVVQAAVDLGLGCLPGPDPFRVPPTSAVSPTFAAQALPMLVEALHAAGIRATLGARYPARHRENLLQLFTTRHRDDARPLVRRLTALAPRVDAVQLELGIPLRWDGPWRARFVGACRTARAVLAVPDAAAPGSASTAVTPVTPSITPARRLQFTGDGVAGLVAMDENARAARLLLFSADGGLTLFTGERAGAEPPDHVGPLAIHADDDALRVRFSGPLLRFPDATPFLDLERGLARARLVDADLTLVFRPEHGGEAADFGRVAGSLTLDGATRAVDARGFLECGEAPAPWPRVRAALHWGDAGLAVTIGLDEGTATGFYCDARGHRAVAAATARLDGGDGGWDTIGLAVELADGERVALTVRIVHRLPVVRAREPAPIRLDFVSCALAGGLPVGWCEIGGWS